MIRAGALAGAMALALAASPATAQFFGRPPADVPQQAVAAPDVAGVSVRVERLEGQIRNLTGQIEQLQNRNRQLEDQLKRFQQDVEFRFQEQGGGARKPAAAPAPAPTGRRSSVESSPLPPASSAATPSAPVIAATPSPSIKVDPGTLGPFAAKPGASGSSTPARPGRGDAFDPSANPNAPGAPRQLGQTAPSAPLPRSAAAGPGSIGSIIDEQDANAPMDLANPRLPANAGEPRVIAAPDAASGGKPADPVRAEYDYALIAYRNGQYDTADALLRQFVQKHPGDKLVADATYHRGETLAQRGRHADAAEQYLKVTTDFSDSSRAPDAMLKLGQSLKAMGAKEQACATFAEIARKHPRATNAIKGAEREMKRSSC